MLFFITELQCNVNRCGKENWPSKSMMFIYEFLWTQAVCLNMFNVQWYFLKRILYTKLICMICSWPVDGYNNSPISYLSPSQLNCPQFCYNPLLPKTGPHSQYITIMPSLQLTCTQDEQFTMLWLFKFNPTLMSTCTISCVH